MLVWIAKRNTRCAFCFFGLLGKYVLFKTGKIVGVYKCCFESEGSIERGVRCFFC